MGRSVISRFPDGARKARNKPLMARTVRAARLHIQSPDHLLSPEQAILALAPEGEMWDGRVVFLFSIVGQFGRMRRP